MKLKKIYLFFILLLTLFTSSLLGSCNREGYDNKEGDDTVKFVPAACVSRAPFTILLKA